MLELVMYIYNEVLELLTAHRLSNFTGNTTRGLPYYVDDSDVLQPMTSESDVWGKLWGIGTGRTGEIMLRGSMRGLSSMSAGVQFVQETQTIGTINPPTGGSFPVGLVRVNQLTTLHVDIRYIPEARYV